MRARSSPTCARFFMEFLSLGTNPLTLIPWFPRLLGLFTNRQRLLQLIEEVDKALYDAIARRRTAGTDGAH